MSVNISGSVIAPQAERTHTEPTTAVAVGEIGEGQSKAVNIGEYRNTGNVTQSVHVADPNNVSGCTFINYAFKEGENYINGNDITLAPGQAMTLLVSIKANERPFGSDPEPFTLDIPSGVWS